MIDILSSLRSRCAACLWLDTQGPVEGGEGKWLATRPFISFEPHLVLGDAEISIDNQTWVRNERNMHSQLASERIPSSHLFCKHAAISLPGVSLIEVGAAEESVALVYVSGLWFVNIWLFGSNPTCGERRVEWREVALTENRSHCVCPQSRGVALRAGDDLEGLAGLLLTAYDRLMTER